MAKIDSIDLNDLMAPTEKSTTTEVKQEIKKEKVSRAPRKSKKKIDKRIHRSFMVSEDFDKQINLIQAHLSETVGNGMIQFKKSDAMNFLIKDAYKEAQRYYND